MPHSRPAPEHAAPHKATESVPRQVACHDASTCRRESARLQPLRHGCAAKVALVGWLPLIKRLLRWKSPLVPMKRVKWGGSAQAGTGSSGVARRDRNECDNKPQTERRQEDGIEGRYQ